MDKNKYPEFSNILELVRELPTEKLLKEYLVYMRWGEKPECVHCYYTEKIYKYSTVGIYECANCKRQFSVLQGTVFERSNIPLDIWYWAMFEFCLGLTTSPVGAGRLQVQQKTAYLINMRLRLAQWQELNRTLQGDVFADEMEIGADPLKDIVVHLDREYRIKKGLPTINTRPIFGMIEGGKAEIEKPSIGKKAKPGGQLLLFDVPDKSADVLKDLLYRYCYANKTNLYTDGWTSYEGLDLQFRKHYVINRSLYGLHNFSRYLQRVNEFTREPATDEEILSGNYVTILTNAIENVWSHVQIDYWRCHGYSQAHAQLYLNEFMFRFNHRHLDVADKFEILLKRCCNTPIYLTQEGNRKRMELTPKFTWRNKRGGGHKWKPIA